MFDTVLCEAVLPDDCAVPDRSFQTKSLCDIMDRFTITAQGRLIYHRCRYSAASRAEGTPAANEPVPIADIDLEHHGDLELFGMTADHQSVRCVARFTHGSLEWNGFDLSTRCRKSTVFF